MLLFRRLFVHSIALCSLMLVPSVALAEGSLVLQLIGKAKSVALPDTPKLSAREQEQHGKPLPDGRVSSRNDGDIRAAWLSKPTDRYGHGVLGDAIEAGAVTVKQANGQLRSFTLPAESVFEDLEPRLADLDGDGRIEVIVVRAYLAKGGAMAVLGLRDDKLVLLAEIPAIGIPNRWLNPSILLDDPQSGKIHVGLVRTPHIGGQLQIWRLSDQRLQMIKAANGFSNHTIGSRALGLSAVLTKGTKRRILIPDAAQSSLLLLDGETLSPLARVPLPARPSQDFVGQRSSNGTQSVEITLRNGKRYLLKDPTGIWFD